MPEEPHELNTSQTMDGLAPGVSEMIDQAISTCTIPLAPMPKFMNVSSNVGEDGSTYAGNHFLPLAAKEDASVAVRVALQIKQKREAEDHVVWRRWFFEHCE